MNVPVRPLVVGVLVGGILGGVLVYGVVGTPPTDGRSDDRQTGTDSESLQELRGQHLWIGGTVERVANGTLYIEDDGAVTGIVLNGNPGLFTCEPDESGIDCRSIEPGAVERGRQVCANVDVRNGTVRAIKVFTGAVCGGPSVPPG